MNPVNATQHPQAAPQPQFFMTGMPPMASATSILKSNVSTAVSSATLQQPTIVTTINNLGSGVKCSATGSNLIDAAKYVTNGANYMPVLLTNQTIISSVDPIKYQQQQHPPKITTSNMMGLAPVVTGSCTSNANISIYSANVNKPMVINSASSTGNNVTYQVLPATQNNNLNPVIAAPNGSVSVILTSSQPMSANGHVAAPIIIRNTPTATTNNNVQIKQQPQLPARQQQHQLQQQKQLQQQQKIKFNTFNPQSMNAEILKQIVVGNPSSTNTTILAPGTTLLKPAILQNNAFIQHKQQPIQNKTAVKNTKMMIATNPQHQLQQKHNQTIITTSAENSSQMFAALGMEVVKSSNAPHTVQKLPQVSLLQNSGKKHSNISEINNETINILKNQNEIKVGNLNSEVSLIKKPNNSIENKSNESSLLKTSNKIQEEGLESHKQDLGTSPKLGTNTANIKDIITNKDSNESCSLLKLSQDLKIDNSGNDINNKESNTQVEKQKSLLKPQICNITTTESSLNTNDQQQKLTSPRSQRSNSYNTQEIMSHTTASANTERRHSEPPKIDLELNTKMAETITKDKHIFPKNEALKSQDLDIFFEDEEYLESSGDKSPTNSDKSNDNCNKSLTCEEEKQASAELLATEDNQQTDSPSPIQLEPAYNSKEIHTKQQNDTQEKETLNSFKDNKPSLQTGNLEDHLSEDDEVTILPAEEVEIEQIEIDDDEDEIEKNIPHTELIRNRTVDKEQLNRSLLCDEQLIISSSSSISNNSFDQSSNATPILKSPGIDSTTTSSLLKKSLMEPKVFNSREESKLNGYSSVLEMLSNFNMLSWREKIGSARGTNLKFQLNEFNLIQLYEKNMSNKRIHTAYEKPIYERESSQKKNENNEPLTYYMCRRCNVQGPSVDFLAPDFCSLACLKRDCRKRRDDSTSLIRKRNRVNNVNNLSKTTASINFNYINETPSINNPPPLTYIRKPKFRWNTYMNRNYNVRAAPISLFLNPFPTGPNNFLVGMKLEAIDPENCSLFCVCTVVSIMGYRLKLAFDGYSNAYDFWVNADSMDIFPPGWCAKTNRILQPPQGIASNKFNWGTYLSKERALPAPRMLFTHLNSSSLVPNNPFKIGMHLEAEDLNDTGKLCVATVADVLDDRIRIHFDGWDECYDIIQDIHSPYIHPCGWHEGRQQLVVPPDCENSLFNWNEYIRSQGNGESASEELFAPREPIGFKTNMCLEVVDPRNPSLIRPASVVSHKGHRVKLHLDGWPSDYCFWLEDDSPDLHPIGWCDATGHDLEPPPGFQTVKQKQLCSVVGCRGVSRAYHASKECCPFAAENWRKVVEKPPRVSYEKIVKSLPKQGKITLAQQVASLQSRLTEQQILERLQMLDNIKTRNVLNQQDKLPSNHTDNILGSLPLSHLKKEVNEPKPCKTYTSTSTSTSPSTSYSEQQISENNTLDVNLDIAREFLYDYGPRLQQNFNLWQTNFSFDADKIKRNPLRWSTTEVRVFVDLYLNCRKTATIFTHEDIDGEAFMLLQQQDLTENLGLKLGPAVKLYTCILQLRTLAVTKFNVPYKSLSTKKVEQIVELNKIKQTKN